MSTFVTIRVEAIRARERVEQLVIDGIPQLDAFEQKMMGTTYMAEFRMLLTYLEYLANGNTLPSKKFRHLKGSADGIPEHELKSKHLRLYAIQLPSKKLIVFLGFKNDQNADISAFRSLKAQFLQSLKDKKNEKK